MNQVPTLVLGIGGIGCKIAAAISDSLSNEDRKYVSIIGIDTNVNDLSKLRDKHQMEIIQTSDDMEVSAYLEAHPEYLEWFPDNDFLRERTMTDGAGQVRTLSRLAFLASVESGRFNPILQEITRIRKVDGNPHNKNLTVMVVGSITGGTGAGLFLNIPFYIRELIKSQAGIKQCVIRGMFVGPDIMEDVQPSQTNKDAVCVNGYTCLKELNAFYMRPAIGKEIANNLRLEFYKHNDTSVQNVPYNYLYLVEKSGDLGSMGDTRIDEVIGYIARVVFVLMFSPVTADALSIEDNFILRLIGEGGMNRYAGAGMCRLLYPIERAQEYVTLSVVRDLVQKEWMLIDQEFTALSRAAMAKMATDSTVKKPELKTSFVELFKKEALGEYAKLGKFAQEAYVEQDSGYISRASEFIAALDRMIEELLDSEAVREKEGDCKVNDEKMKNFSDAEAQISDVWEGMRKYAQYAKHLIDTKPNGFADDLFPTSKEVMDFHKDRPECIYQYLAKVHPVTARFFIYDIINRLEAKIAELKTEIMGVDLSAYTKEDFDLKTDDVQGPAEALGAIRDKRHPIWKMLGPVGQAINGEEKALIKLKRRLREVCDTHVSTTHDYIENSLKYRVSQLVLERMITLADNYTVFFNTVAAKIDRNNENITRLENIHFPYGQDGIYCSRDAFRKMATDFLQQQPQDLTDKTKAAIFEQIYLVQSRSYTISSTAETKAAKERRMQEDKKKLEAVFNTAVIETIRTNVIEHGAGIVNLTAREALIKEFGLIKQKIPDDPGYADEIQKYAQKRIATALKVAAPMLTTERVREDTELTFIALSPACAETDAELKPDTTETAKFYLPITTANATVIINPEFDDTELACMRLSYNFTIEDLTKYKAGARNAIAYNDRITNLGVKRVFNYNSDEMIVVVNPHLNSHWHEEGFIPSIHGKQRQKDHLDNLKAFIYAMGFDCFRLIADDDNPDENDKPRPTWYSYIDGFTQFQPVRKCGKLIGNGYSDLFDAILYNRTLKLAILRYAQKAVSMMKGYNTTDELFDNILENRFIEDLIQPIASKDADDINLFDAFMKMRSHMPVDDWYELFDGLLITLWEFCEILFDKSERHINKAVKLILTEIFKNSAVGMKQESDYSKSETLLKAQYDIILAKKYGSN
jgi:hypothetical protein